jgi:hypothetical protein
MKEKMNSLKDHHKENKHLHKSTIINGTNTINTNVKNTTQHKHQNPSSQKKNKINSKRKTTPQREKNKTNTYKLVGKLTHMKMKN